MYKRKLLFIIRSWDAVISRFLLLLVLCVMDALMMYRIGVNRDEVLHGPSVTQQQVTTCLILWRNFSHGDFGDCRSGPRFDIYSWHIPSESAVNKILGGKRRGLPRRLFDITSSKGNSGRFQTFPTGIDCRCIFERNSCCGTMFSPLYIAVISILSFSLVCIMFIHG